MSNSKQTEERIVRGGGWVKGPACYQRKAQLFRALTVLWIFPSIGSVVILLLCGEIWWAMGGLLAGVRGLAVEQWIALGLLLAHPGFAWLAWRFRRTEPLSEVKILLPNPDHDLRKLY